MSERDEMLELRRQLEAERREKEEVKARMARMEAMHRKTTLSEYLYNSHYHIYQKLSLANTSQSSTGYTKVNGKYYPKWLRPWAKFTHQRQHHFDAIWTICGKRRLFYPASTTRDFGTTVSREPAGNEKAVEYFEKLAVEDSVQEVLRLVWDEEELRKEYGCTGLRFSHNIRDLNQLGDGDQILEEDPIQEKRRRTGPNKRAASEQKVNSLTTPDGAGVRTRPNGEETLAFVFDYKAAHKIASKYLKPAIAKENLFMEVMEQINSGKVQSDDELKKRDNAEALIAMALVQVFDYMVRFEVEYGYVAAGSSLLFLHIDRTDLQTLYCHPCVPETDVGQEPSDGDYTDEKLSQTAVAQLASFCLLSLGSEALKGASLDAASRKAEATLRKWGVSYDDAACLLGIEDTDSHSASLPSSQETEGSEFVSDEVAANREISLRSKSSCRTMAVRHRDEDEGDDGGPDDRSSQPRGRTNIGKRKEYPSSGSSEAGEEADTDLSESAPTKQYCTQTCLLGLKRGWNLDDDCPNISWHRTAEGSTRHPIDINQFAHLVGDRLRQNPYRDCQALDGWGKRGAIGVLFKLELAPYGYTFVGKGTIRGYRHLLEHESHIYAHLDRLQGEAVPVHLGLEQLDRGYIFPGGARVFHMMLMSWGGEGLTNSASAGANVADLDAEVRRSSREVWDEGVDHGDLREANQLWNEERGRVMIIDFDQAALRPKPKHKQLSQVSRDKKKRRAGGSTVSKRRRDFCMLPVNN